MADGWKFYRDADDKWRWKYIMQGKSVAQAYKGFEQYPDCIADARVHGYREQARERVSIRKMK